MKPWQLCAAACVVACAWLTDAGAKRSVATVRWQHAVAPPVVAKDEARVIPVSLPVIEPIEFFGPFAPRGITDSEAKDYLIKTATRGFTMHKQGMDISIGYIQPQCRIRFANAIKEARASGLTKAGIFSGYRIPALGVGGFANKLESTHAAGLAADMAGIGRPGSKDAIKWWLIAGRHKLNVVYGPWHRAEWNHTQCTDVKVMRAGLPIRKTYTKAGPSVPEKMWQAASLLLRPTVLIPKSVKPPVRYAKKISKARYAKHHKRRYASAS